MFITFTDFHGIDAHLFLKKKCLVICRAPDLLDIYSDQLKCDSMTLEGSGSALVSQPSCPVCLRMIAVTNAGLIRQHGPVASRCPGSRRQPSFLASAPTAPLQPSHQRPSVVEGQDVCPAQSPSPDAALPPRWLGKVIKRLPKASKECTGSLPLS